MKFLYWAKRLKDEKRNSPLSVYTALLSIVLCMICLAGTTWAWFTANQIVGVGIITSAQYGILVSIAGEGYTEGEPEGNMRFYTLAPDKSYTITLTTVEESTATTGYCLVSVDDTVYYTAPITAEDSFTFTCQTGMEVPEELTTAEYDNMISEKGDTNLAVAWYWGTYPNTQDSVGFDTDPGYVLLENGAVLGTAPGEVLLKAELTLNLTDISVPENDGLITLNEDYSLVLTPNEGYELPEYISVEIDGTAYEIYTDGVDHRDIFLDELCESESSLMSPIPVFDPLTGTLTIPAELLTADIQSVIISAAAVKSEDEGCICEIRCTALNENCQVCRDSVEGCTGNEDSFEVIEIVEITEESDVIEEGDSTGETDSVGETDSTGETDSAGETGSEETAESDEIIDLTGETESAEGNDSAETTGPAEIIEFSDIMNSEGDSDSTEATGAGSSGTVEAEIMELSITLDPVSADLSETAITMEEIIIIE